MNEQEIFDKVQAIISEQLGVEKSQVTKDANFANDLGNVDRLLNNFVIVRQLSSGWQFNERITKNAPVLVLVHHDDVHQLAHFLLKPEK